MYWECQRLFQVLFYVLANFMCLFIPLYINLYTYSLQQVHGESIIFILISPMRKQRHRRVKTTQLEKSKAKSQICVAEL